MEEQKQAEDLYRTLGVAPDATPEAVKRAYFRLVRAYRPDVEPEEFQRLQAAYATLGTPHKRRHYDQICRYGAEISKRLDEADALMESEPQRVIRLLKEVLILAPDAHDPRLLLSKANLKIGEYQNAELELKRLINRKPGDAVLHYELAYCLWMQERATEAQHEIDHTLRLDPFFYDALMLMAHIHQVRREPSRATDCLERAIALNGREDYNDFATLLRLLTIYVVENDEANMAKVESRLLATLSPDDKMQIAEGMNKIHDLAADFYKNRNFRGAYQIIQRATHPGLRDVEIIDRITRATQRMARADEASIIAQDNRISGAMQTYICGKYLTPQKEEINEKAIEALMARVLEEAQKNSSPYRLMLEHLRSRYEIIGDGEQNLFFRLDELVGAASPAIESSSENSSEDPSQPPAYIPRKTVISAARGLMTRWRSN